MKHFLVSVLVAAGVVACLAPLHGAPAPPPFTGEQARKGQTLFYEDCAECHGGALEGKFGPALSGGEGNLQWATVSYVWQYMTAHMPAGNAGGLTREQYVDIMAFLLERHGALPSAKPLTVNAALESKAYLGPP